METKTYFNVTVQGPKNEELFDVEIHIPSKYFGLCPPYFDSRIQPIGSYLQPSTAYHD